MKSKIFFGVTAMLMLVSCEKSLEMEYGNETEKTFSIFTASTESALPTRTSLSASTNSDNRYSLNWKSGDKISISDGKSTAIFTTDDNNTPNAEFTKSMGAIDITALQYTAFYPSTITTSNMELPSSQNYVIDNIENYPMYAISTNKELSFKNLCGIIRFSLKSEENEQVKISSISLSADKGMSGVFSIDNDNAAVVSGNDGVVLKCSEIVTINANTTTDFNIVIPKGEYNPLKVKICDANGKEINLVSESSITVRRSEITRITLTLAKSTFETSLETIPISDSNVDFTER